MTIPIVPRELRAPDEIMGTAERRSVMATAFIDFVELKERVSIEQVVQMLDLKLKKHGAQMRGPCPVHGGGDRTFVVTPGRGFYCFAEKQGGDQIALVSHVNAISAREAAGLIAERFMKMPEAAKPTEASAKATPSAQKGPLQPLSYLEAAHESVQALGVAPETAQAWGAGYAPKGIMRGRFAIPIHDREGVLLAYCGRAVKGESPALLFPNGFDPHGVIFAAERVKSGPLYLVRDPLQVLTAFEAGVENVVAFLTDGISAQQLEQLAALMDERKCESIELY
jgi:DNA primase